LWEGEIRRILIRYGIKKREHVAHSLSLLMQTADFGQAVGTCCFPLFGNKVTLRLLNTNKGIPLNSVLSLL